MSELTVNDLYLDYGSGASANPILKGVSMELQRGEVVAGMRLSYRSGAASLLELLAAQRSADDAYVAYLQAQADAATATVQLELSIGRHPSL